MYLIIVETGETGRNLVELAVQDGHDVVAIEIDEEKASMVPAEYDCLVLNADATTEGTLQEAAIDDTDAVFQPYNFFWHLYAGAPMIANTGYGSH